MRLILSTPWLMQWLSWRTRPLRPGMRTVQPAAARNHALAKRRTLWLCFAVLLHWSLPSHASSSLLVAAFLKQQQLSGQVATYVGDEKDKIPLNEAMASAAELDALIKQVSTTYGAKAPELSALWAKERQALYEGLLKRGYEASTHMLFIKVQADVSKTLLSLLNFNTVKPSILAGLEVSNAVANYLLFSTSPTGSFDISTSNEGANFELKVQQIDQLIDKVTGQPGQQHPNSEVLRSIRSKWSFLRSALLNAGTQSAPFIVKRIGGALVSTLITL